jgi:uroporphyrinogen-III decarboxylase
MLTLINEGLTPCPLWEGNCTSRLEIIGDIPPGKAVYWFEQTDIFKAKEILGDTVCIRGNVPASLLIAGSPQQVQDYCKKLIDIVGKDGGFIMDGATGIPDEAKPENVAALEEITKDYGKYR